MMTTTPTRPLVALLTIAALTTCAANAAEPAPHHHRTCRPPGARTLAQDHEVRVYSLKVRRSPEGIYACLRRHGATVVIARPGRTLREPVVGRIAIAGAMVAYTNSTAGVDTASTSIEVLDVVHRHVVLTVPQAAGFVDACVIQFRRITDLLVTAHGSIAWISSDGSQCKTTTLQVYSAQVSGAPNLLDESAAIAPASLRFAHGTVHWEDGGRSMSEPLP